jgi:hypothetical protein
VVEPIQGGFATLGPKKRQGSPEDGRSLLSPFVADRAAFPYWRELQTVVERVSLGVEYATGTPHLLSCRSPPQ